MGRLQTLVSQLKRTAVVVTPTESMLLQLRSDGVGNLEGRAACLCFLVCFIALVPLMTAS